MDIITLIVTLVTAFVFQVSPPDLPFTMPADPCATNPQRASYCQPSLLPMETEVWVTSEYGVEAGVVNGYVVLQSSGDVQYIIFLDNRAAPPNGTPTERFANPENVSLR